MILRATPRAHSVRMSAEVPCADNPPAPNDPAEIRMENGEQAATPFGDLARGTMATVLIVGAIPALAITTLMHSHDKAIAQSHAPAASAPATLTVPLSVPRDSGEAWRFAFGYVEFDWDPDAPGGVPGFDSWPPGSRRR